MISNLAKYFHISNELKENEKLDIISNEIIKAMQNENNIYKWISLVGINNIFKIFKICPGLQYFNSLNTIYYYFENYYINKSEFKKENTEIYEILKNIDNQYKLSKLINSIIKGENERQLIYLVL
jgi:hypothetical protein